MKNVLTLVQSSPPSLERLTERTISRRAVEAAIWGIPIVSFEAMRQAFLHEARYGDILYLSKPADWRFRIPTPNPSSLYVYFNFNLKDGPMVLDFPAAIGAGLFGTILDAWQVPLADVGPEGEDRGVGGKYLLIPPDAEDIPRGYFNVRSETYNGYALLRALPATQSESDVEQAIELVKQLRLYRLGGKRFTQRHIDISGKLFDGLVRYDDTFYDSLARMIDEEPVQPRDLAVMGQTHSLGIRKFRPFRPPESLRSALRDAIAEVHRGFMESARNVEPYWSGSQWGLQSHFAPRSRFSFQSEDRLAVDERGAIYFLGCAPAKVPSTSSFLLTCAKDAAGAPLTGGNFYRLRVPRNPSGRQNWAITVYDLATAGFILNSPVVGIDSYKDSTESNADGSVDVYFGPRPLDGQESNWVYTGRRGEWLAMFRPYGPKKSVLEKTWVLPNIERIEP